VNQSTDVLTIDVRERPPLLPGNHDLWRVLTRERADVIDARYRSGHRAGRVLRVHFSDDFCVVINDGLWGIADSFEAVWRGDGQYVLSLRLSGNCLESINQNTYPLGPHTCSLIYYGKGVKHVFRLMPGEPLVEVCVVFRASFLISKCGMTISEAATFLHPLSEDALDPWFSQCSMTTEMEAVVRSLRLVPPFGRSRFIFAEAKALEALSLYLRQLEERSDKCRLLPRTSEDLRRLHIARQFLGKHYRNPPRIDALCGIAGLNRRKLTEGFKSEFGRTVFGYIQYLRLEHARALFQNGVTDVNRVARQVGYAHQSNFAKAFKRYLGISPRQCFQIQRPLGDRARPA